MNAKDTCNTGSTALFAHLPSPENQLSPFAEGEIDLEQFVTAYYAPVNSTIARLIGLDHWPGLSDLTTSALGYLWANRDLLAKEKRPGVFIYKLLLQEVFSYLKRQGNLDRIRLLHRILPVDPACYLHHLEGII